MAKTAFELLTGLLRTVKVSGDLGVPGLAKSNLSVDFSKLPRKLRSGKDGEFEPTV